MNHRIPEFVPRQPLQRQLGAGVLNKILRELESLRIIKIAGGTVRKLPGGTEITVDTERGGSSPSTHPFQLTVVTNPTNPSEKQIRVRYGTINNVAPTGMSLGDDPPYLLTPSGTEGIIYAVVVFDRSDASCPILSRDLGMDDELPPDDQETAHIEIGSYVVDGQKITVAQAVSGSLFVDPYGFTFQWGLV